jgi:hypothetical protein
MRKRAIFVHVGLHKTGSTAIQRMLSDNSRILLKDGFLYPKVGQISEPVRSLGHHRLAWSLHRDPNLMSLWGELREEITRSRAENVLLSSEEFEFVRQAAHYQRMRAELPEARFQIICYLRRQDELLESEYNQHIKQGGTNTPGDFITRMMRRLNYGKYLHVLEEVFGRQNMIVRVYEKSQLEGGLYVDFFQCLGLKLWAGYTLPTGTVNPSLSAAGLALMHLLNQHITDRVLLRRLRRCVVQHYSSEPFRHEGTILSAPGRRCLVEHFAPGNADIARRYMGRPSGHLFSDEIADTELPAVPDKVCEPVIALLQKHLNAQPHDAGAYAALRSIRSVPPHRVFSHAPLSLALDDRAQHGVEIIESGSKRPALFQVVGGEQSCSAVGTIPEPSPD